MPKTTQDETPDVSSFASRRVEREAREAAEGVPARRDFNRVDQSSEFTIGNVTVSRVQA